MRGRSCQRLVLHCNVGRHCNVDPAETMRSPAGVLKRYSEQVQGPPVTFSTPAALHCLASGSVLVTRPGSAMGAAVAGTCNTHPTLQGLVHECRLCTAQLTQPIRCAAQLAC
jgi:hypothetical protein